MSLSLSRAVVPATVGSDGSSGGGGAAALLGMSDGVFVSSFCEHTTGFNEDFGIDFPDNWGPEWVPGNSPGRGASSSGGVGTLNAVAEPGDVTAARWVRFPFGVTQCTDTWRLTMKLRLKAGEVGGGAITPDRVFVPISFSYPGGAFNAFSFLLIRDISLFRLELDSVNSVGDDQFSQQLDLPDWDDSTWKWLEWQDDFVNAEARFWEDGDARPSSPTLAVTSYVDDPLPAISGYHLDILNVLQPYPGGSYNGTNSSHVVYNLDFDSIVCEMPQPI